MISLGHKQNNARNILGFTMIEMLIAVFIFSLSLAGIMLMSSEGLKSARNSQQRVTAEFLAVEGVEVVRNIRDKAFLFGYDTSSWQGVFQADNILGSSGCFDNGDPCEFEYDSSDGTYYLSACSNGCRIYLHDTYFEYYDYNGSQGTDSGFVREIYLDSVAGTNNKEIEVRVVVSWGNNQVVYTDNLFLWQ